MLILLSMHWLGDVINHREHTLYAFRHVGESVKIILGLSVVMTVIFYAIFFWFAPRIDTKGVHGRTYWGFKYYLPWNELANINAMSFRGIPALILTSESGKEIWVYRMGLRRKSTYDELVSLLGHEHNFVGYFE